MTAHLRLAIPASIPERKSVGRSVGRVLVMKRGASAARAANHCCSRLNLRVRKE